MRNRIFGRWLGLALVVVMTVSLLVIVGHSTEIVADESPEDCPNCSPTAGYPVMRPDNATIERWIASYEAAPQYAAKPEEQPSTSAAAASSYSVLNHLDYDTVERDQGGCGNCWIWAGTGCMEITHDVENGIFDRLSIQYINSYYGSGDGSDYACCGGWLSDFAHFYDKIGYPWDPWPLPWDYHAFAIPWSNSNAYWQDWNTGCGDDTNVEGASISKIPFYNIQSMQDIAITTHGVSENAAIANIKSVLNSNQGVWFGFFLPDFYPFFDFWDHHDPGAVWDFDPYAGEDYDDGANHGGHAVLCVGYNDDVGTDNDYWIMLNSWGNATGNRPDGLFRVKMHMNYSATLKDLNTPYGGYITYWQKLDMDFRAPHVEAGPDQTADEGDTVNFSGSYTWPEFESPFIIWDFGDGNTSEWWAPLTPTHVYSDNGVYTVTLTVTGLFGNGPGRDTLTVTVGNAAPVVSVVGDTIDEDGTATVRGNITDGGSLDSHTVVIDWGEGAPEYFSYAAGDIGFNASHRYRDDNPTGTPSDDYAVTVNATDDDGGVGTQTTIVTVNNVDPVVAGIAMAQPDSQFILPAVHELDFTGTFMDVGTQDTHTAVWDWGDMSSSAGVVSESDGSGTVNGSHIYFAPGNYTVTLNVTDDDRGSNSNTYSVHVNNVDEALITINDYIQGLDNSCFSGNADRRKATIDRMFNPIAGMWAAERYTGLIRYLRDNLRARADGYVGGRMDDDWITDSASQVEICQRIDDITAYLETLL